MSKGILVFAYNNGSIDYIKQAVYLARRVKKYLKLPTTVVTDNVEYAAQWKNDFDKIVFLKGRNSTKKTYYDGSMASHTLAFKNDARSSAYELTPYKQTLLLDSDFIIADNNLIHCFDGPNSFMIYKDAYDLANFRDYSEFNFISDTGVEFYWATCVYFTKCQTNQIFFDLVKHIQENWKHYSYVYRLETPVYRNDHVFSIAIHVMNNFQKGDFAKKLPGRMFFITDKDILHSLDDDGFTVLLEKENFLGQYTLAKFTNKNLHVMNKFSLAEHIDV